MKKITYLSQAFSDYRSFEQEFKTVFSKEKTVSVIKAPVRSGKTYHAEQFMCKHLDNTSLQTPCVIVFLTVKNLLAESTYLNIMEKTANSDNLLLFRKETSKDSLKKLKQKFSLKKKRGIVLISTYSYFNGERFSQLRHTLIDQVFGESKLELKFIVDEGEAFLNECFQSIVLSKPIDRNFKTAIKGNNKSCLDSQRATLSKIENANLKFGGTVELFGRVYAQPADSETFNNFSFRLNNNKNEGIDIKLETYGAIISNFVVYRKIKTISINICDKFWTIFSIDENNRLLIDETNLFTSLAKLYEVSYSQFFSLMSLVDGVVHSAYLYEKSFTACHPGMVDKPLCYDSASERYANYKTAKFSYTSTSESATSKPQLSDYLSSPRHGCLYESTLCLNKNYYIHNLINIPRATHVFLSGTWNKFTLESALEYPPYIYSLHHRIKVDISKLCHMVTRDFGLQPIDKSDQFINLRNLNEHAELVKSTLLSDRFQNSKLKEDIAVAEVNMFVDLKLKK